MARFFIDRPVFAIVLAIIITLLGTIAGFSLPIAQYPNITKPRKHQLCMCECRYR